MKARFSCSETWNMSVVRQGMWFRYSTSRLSKPWKPCYVCFRDDTSLRWYKDAEFLERKGELWLEEVAGKMLFGQHAWNKLLTLLSRKPATTKWPVVPHYCLAIPDITDRCRRRWFWFCCANQQEYNEWISAISKTLQEKRVQLPIEFDRRVPLSPTVEQQIMQEAQRVFSSEDAPSSWDLLWFVYPLTSAVKNNEVAPDDVVAQTTPRCESTVPGAISKMRSTVP